VRWTSIAPIFGDVGTALPADDDEIFRAGKRAQVAADAKRFPGFRMVVQAGRAAIAFRNHRPLEGILLGIDIFRALRAERHTHALQNIQLQNPPDKFLHDDSLFALCPDVKDSRRTVRSQFPIFRVNWGLGNEAVISSLRR